MLESDETSRGPRKEASQEYYSPIVSHTIEQVNEELCRYEDTSMIGKGSGVIRCDKIEIPSNTMIEDWSDLSAVVQEDEISRVLLGIYDGHA